jgi:hypothetical protein
MRRDSMGRMRGRLAALQNTERRTCGDDRTVIVVLYRKV